ncbi:MAG: hypothetical protein ABR548_13435 [Actinomycetota bacterium]|nr:hypothetical protein [Actinomycetota bacterium]
MERIDDIQALDRALDRLIAAEHLSAPAPLVELVSVAREARTVLALQMREDTAALHIQILRGEEPGSWEAPASPARRSMAVFLLAAAMSLTLVTGSAFAASSHASAGQSLFGVKRAFERAGLAMRHGHSRAVFRFEIVQRRLAELRSVAGDPVAEERARAAYEAALAEADRGVTQTPGVLDDDVVADNVRQELHNNVVALRQLLELVPERARPGIQRALDHATAAEQHVKRGHRPDDSGRNPAGTGKKSRRETPPASRSKSLR